MDLPKKRMPPLRKDPKRIVLFGQPKVGKTTIVSALPNCLIVDMEEGANYIEGMIVKITNLSEYYDLIKALKKEKEDNDGKMPYRFIALDTLTALEELSLPLAAKLYRKTPMAVTWEGTDVRTLAKGAGYLYTRTAFLKMLKPLEKYCDVLIMVGHVKEKDISKDGDSYTTRSINLTGKVKDIVCAWADTIGLVYREDEKTIIDFMPSEELHVGSRQKHLIGKKITVAESDEKGNLNIDWNKVFIEENSNLLKK